MTIKEPTDITALWELWQQAFGDSDQFLDRFFTKAYSPQRCRCVYDQGTLVAMLYWFDCSLNGQKLAYLYAVATDRSCQGRGFCQALIEDTHRHLKKQGYIACALVPGSGELFRLYEKLGYQVAGTVREITAAAGDAPVPLRPVDRQEYAALRRQYLPENGVVQEGEALRLLGSYANFYAGADFLLAAWQEEGSLRGELLGNGNRAAEILTALGYDSGTFRTPGGDTPFAMAYSLTEKPLGTLYLGLALD